MKNTGSTYKTMLGEFSSAKGDLRLLNVTAGFTGRSYMDFHKVPGRLQEFCEWLNEQRTQLAPSDILAAYNLSFDVHFRLVTIHPWADGNGRMARLLMNHLQFEHHLIPVKITKEQKADYIQALIDTREQDDLNIFRKVMLSLHIANLQHEIEQYRKSIAEDFIGDKATNVTDVTDRQKAILAMVKENAMLSTAQMSEKLNVAKRTILRDIDILKTKGMLLRVGSEKTGHWEFNKGYPALRSDDH